MRNWQEWFIPPDEGDTEYSRMEAEAEASGSRHSSKKLHLQARPQPRCVSCRKFMGYSSGMYIMINDPWRLHISCFERVVEERFEAGEVIDLTTGAIHQLEQEESAENGCNTAK